MTLKLRRFKEHPIEQGADEVIAYTIDTTPWGGSPSNPSSVIKVDGVDESATYMNGSASVDGDDVITKAVQNLVKGARYRLEVSFEISGNTFEAYGDILCSEE